jgi:hypothetical protein
MGSAPVENHPKVEIAMEQQQSKLSLSQIYDRLHATPEMLRDFCRKWDIAELALFGSSLRNNF